MTADDGRAMGKITQNHYSMVQFAPDGTVDEANAIQVI